MISVRRAGFLGIALAMALVVPGHPGDGPSTDHGNDAQPDTVQLVETVQVTDSTDGVERRVDGSRPERAAATFAGGCFWCMEGPFDDLPGVASTIVGYTGGHVADPSYEQVSSGGTGHREAVRVTYDPSRISYTRLLQVFWHNVDPVDGGGQFCDRGGQYTSGIFVHNGEQEALARASRDRLERSGLLERPVATPVVAADTFYRAEDYHQDYYQRNPVRYKLYRWNCGRDDRLREIWGEAAGR
jgi:peptide-methionine (S)-S-oxide reductase